jgi:hypothetical protein
MDLLEPKQKQKTTVHTFKLELLLIENNFSPTFLISFLTFKINFLY